MPVRGLLFIASLVAGASGLGYLVAVDNTGQLPSAAAFTSKPASSTPPVGTQAGLTQAPTPKTPIPDDNPVRFMLASVAEQYQQASRYPPYSLPLSEAQAKAYRGNVFQPVVLPLADGGRFTVILEKFRFTRGEDILVVAQLSGPPVVARTMRATLESTGDRTAFDSTVLRQQSNDLYQGALDSDVRPGEYRLVVEASVDSKPLRNVSTLTIEPDLGKFTGLGDVRVTNNDLLIPVEFDARESGYYRLGAQLYNQGRPLAQLSAEHHLDSTASTITLRAHGSVIADRDISGKLQLRGLQIQRLPARPGDRTDYAFGPEEGFDFSPPDLDGLRNTRAGDPESEQRAAMLKSMAAGL